MRTLPVDATRIAEALGQHAPTDEQAAVIEAPLEPVLVVAGAGAGKTETMAARVVWLVANGFVAPEQILGLTFTRKAAQQLTTRIRRRLAKLAGSTLVRDLDPTGALRARILGSEPEVGTYHAYAGRLLGEHGLLLPIEPSATLLSETELWQTAHRVVSAWDGELDTDRNPASVTESVLALSAQLAEHLVDPDDLSTAHTELSTLVTTLPAGPGQRGGPTRKLMACLETQEERVQLLPLVQRLADTLRRDGALDFGSQMSLAARLARDHPEVGTAERSRFRVVLLDEYQDTGHAQRVLLSSLFGGGLDDDLAVTAVGDPMQSIYGWRGASAANLPRFATDFARPDGTPARTLELLTSWRNPAEALELANVVSEPLRDRGVAVSRLRSRPDAPRGDVRISLHSDVAAEREWVADCISAEYAAARKAGDPPPTAAVLVRRNADAAPLAEALRGRGLPVEVVGLGGLLHTPEVADVIAMLRLAADPMAGSAAIRVLTGARWQIGAADLRALWRRAQELAITGRFGVSGAVTDPSELDDALGAVLPGEYADEAGLADAISDPGPPDRYSKFGFDRIRSLARQLASVRERLGQPLTELVAEVERILGIGIETQARVGSRTGVAGREHLDAFADVVAAYSGRGHATLPGLLTYLSAAEDIEKGLAPGEIEVDPERVQILTVHSAKGLEWEVVVVPHLTAGVFPSTTGASTWLGALAELPPRLRGDRALRDEDGRVTEGVPVLDLDGVADRKMLENALDAHKDALARRRDEEDRRLFYVALTRTERVLLASGSHWAESGTEPKGPSEFLEELHAVLTARSDLGTVSEWAAAPAPGTANPMTETPRTAVWPSDPLGSRRPAVEHGAALVLDAIGAGDPDPVEGADSTEQADDFDEWAADVDALLAERRERDTRAAEVVLPAQMSVSQLVDLATDPDALAARIRRPMPFQPNPLARRGTAFHAWLERRFGATRLLDLDELPGADDEGGDESDFDRLQEAFLRSPWAVRNPVEVEVPFETTLAGTVIRGRIDAVFEDPDGGWTVIDWKTGAEPEGEKLASVSMQLAAYRMAWAQLMAARTARLTGRPAELPLGRVRAAFHYVRTGRTIAPEDLPDPEMLERLVRNAGAATGGERRLPDTVTSQDGEAEGA